MKRKRKKNKFLMGLSILFIIFLLNVYSLNVLNTRAFVKKDYSLDESIWIWTTTTVVSTESSDESRFPEIAADSYGNIHVVWLDSADYLGAGTDWDVFYKRWNDSTSIWTTTEIVTTGSPNNSENPAIAVDAEGNAHIAWSEENEYGASGSEHDIFYRVWNATTSSWNSIEVVSTESTSTSRYPSIIVDSKKNVHIAWMDYTNYAGSGIGPPDIFYKYWNASLSTWTLTEVVSVNSTAWADETSIGVDGAGNVHLAWHDHTNIVASGGDADIFYDYRDSSTSSWNNTELVSVGSSDGSEHPSIAVDSTGNVYIVWQDATDHYIGSGTDTDIFYKCWNSSTAAWSTIEVVSAEISEDSRDPSIAVDSIGNVHIAWWEWTGISYKFLDASTSTWTSKEAVSTESSMSECYPSITVDTARNVHITWQDNTDYAGAGTDYDIFYKKTEEPPVFPEMTFNLPFSHRAIVIIILISCNFVSLLIVKKRYKITKQN